MAISEAGESAYGSSNSGCSGNDDLTAQEVKAAPIGAANQQQSTLSTEEAALFSSLGNMVWTFPQLIILRGILEQKNRAIAEKDQTIANMTSDLNDSQSELGMLKEDFNDYRDQVVRDKQEAEEEAAKKMEAAKKRLKKKYKKNKKQDRETMTEQNKQEKMEVIENLTNGADADVGEPPTKRVRSLLAEWGIDLLETNNDSRQIRTAVEHNQNNNETEEGKIISTASDEAVGVGVAHQRLNQPKNNDSEEAFLSTPNYINFETVEQQRQQQFEAEPVYQPISPIPISDYMCRKDAEPAASEAAIDTIPVWISARSSRPPPPVQQPPVFPNVPLPLNSLKFPRMRMHGCNNNISNVFPPPYPVPAPSFPPPPRLLSDVELPLPTSPPSILPLYSNNNDIRPAAEMPLPFQTPPPIVPSIHSNNGHQVAVPLQLPSTPSTPSLGLHSINITNNLINLINQRLCPETALPFPPSTPTSTSSNPPLRIPPPPTPPPSLKRPAAAAEVPLRMQRQPSTSSESDPPPQHSPPPPTPPPLKPPVPLPSKEYGLKMMFSWNMLSNNEKKKDVVYQSQVFTRAHKQLDKHIERGTHLFNYARDEIGWRRGQKKKPLLEKMLRTDWDDFWIPIE